MTGPDTSEVAHTDVERFEAERSRLRGLAYRMTGTPDDADDVVQEAWLRWQRADRSAIDNAAAWLTTPGSYVVRDGQPFLLTVLGWRGSQVAEAISIVNPDKLQGFHAAWLQH